MLMLNKSVKNFFSNFTDQNRGPIMDAKVKKACPSCSQNYSMRCPQQPKSRLPLLQKCGHSCCEVCLQNMVKFAEPIVCKICQRETEFPDNVSPDDLYSLFPINVYMVGELALQLMDNNDTQQSQEKDYFIDLKEILNAAETAKGICVECKAPTTKLCRECVTVLCENCFNKIHKFHIFKSHVLTNIEALSEPSFCSVHREKQLDYFCKDCSKTVCMDCMIVGGERSCKNHDVIPVQEVNEIVLEELNDMAPKIDETYRRLTKTAVEIGHLLKNIESGTGDSELDKLKSGVFHHFSKLLAAVQAHLQETMDTMNKLKNIEKMSLQKAKSSVEESIKTAVAILKKTNAAMTSQSRHKANLSAILEEAKQVMNAPWYLIKEVKKQDPLKVCVNSDVCALVGDYVQLTGNAEPGYLLLPSDFINSEELPPLPATPVFPPEMIKDVRETVGFKKSEPAKTKTKPKSETRSEAPPPALLTSAPKYRSKSGSNTSLNSLGSDHSGGRAMSVRSSNSRGETIAPVMPVMPYPKPLIEGSQELVYISHIVSPSELFVQRASHQPHVKEMLREFRTGASLPKPSPTHLAEGKIYLAFNKTDNEWQRCRVLSLDRDCSRPAARVFCIDFGCTELVALDQLRLLPSARMNAPPALAVPCALANCAPNYGAWSADDAVLVQKIIDNKKVVMHVRGTDSGGMGGGMWGAAGGLLHVDLTTAEDGVSLIHALVFHDRARIIDPSLPYARMAGLSERPQLISSSDFRLKTPEDVVITHVVSPDHFYVRRCHFQTTFENLCDELNDAYSLGVTTGTIYCPEVGMFCVVHVEGDEGGWRRGVVAELPGRLRVRLALPDTGEAVLVHYSALRRIQPEFAKQKALATECHLSGVTPLNRRWSAGSVALLSQYMRRPLRLVVEEARARSSLGVALYQGEDECINTLMVRHKFAVTIGLYTFNKEQPIEDQYTIKTPQEKKMAQPEPKKKIKILKKNAKPPVKEEDLEAKDKGPLKLEVKVLSCHSPSLLYVSLVDQQKIFKELFEALQEHYVRKKPNEKKTWSVGEKCCTVYRETKTWRRAVIVTLQEDKATVFFSDFAIVDTVPVAELRELEPEFAKVGDGAIKCHLSGIAPALGGDWPSLTKEFLRELLDAYQRIFITKNGAIRDKSLPVEVWVYHVVAGAALEPDRAEWRCLNNKIIDQGLAVPDKEQELSAEQEKREQDDDMISIFNITGSVHEWLQLGKVGGEKKEGGVVGGSRSPSPEPERDDAHTKLVSDWLPPEPLDTAEFVGVPTYVDGEGHVYLHSVAQQGTLELIRNALDVRFRASAAARRAAWDPAQPCVAKFYLDDKFYRGRILEVEEEGAVVHYIDYGNEERCALADLRANIVLHEIPTQAHKCRLARVRPIGAAWDKATLDYLHKSIVEKQCLVRVTGPAAGGVLPVDLKIDKLWINDHLVDFELARYTDGKKPVVPKFQPAPKALDQSLDSGPDYIVEDEASVSSDTSAPSQPADWNAMLEADPAAGDSFITFPDNDLGQEFICNVLCIGTENLIFELSAVHDDETNLEYEEMFAELQAHGDECLPLDGIYEQKACVAKYHEDGHWYRAAILEYSKIKEMIKVKYVDYGNYEIIPVSEAREIRPEWALRPPRAVPAALRGLAGRRVEPSLPPPVLQQALEDTFISKGPFHVKVVEDAPVLVVELTNEEGSVPYEHLIANGVFVEFE